MALGGYVMLHLLLRPGRITPPPPPQALLSVSVSFPTRLGGSQENGGCCRENIQQRAVRKQRHGEEAANGVAALPTRLSVCIADAARCGKPSQTVSTTGAYRYNLGSAARCCASLARQAVLAFSRQRSRISRRSCGSTLCHASATWRWRGARKTRPPALIYQTLSQRKTSFLPRGARYRA